VPHPIHHGRFGVGAAELDVADGVFAELFLTTGFFPVVLSLLGVLVLADVITTDAFTIIGNDRSTSIAQYDSYHSDDPVACDKDIRTNLH